MKKTLFTLLLLCLAIVAILGIMHIGKRPTTQLIGIVQYVHHPLLDETNRGLLAGLDEYGLNDGVKYRVKTQVAEKNAQLCGQIVRQFRDEHASIIVAIATPAAQAAAAQAQDIPVVFAAITDPVAAKLVQSIDHPGRSITGTSNRWPFDKQISLIPYLLPSARKIGAVWNPGEVNSEAAMRFIRPLLQKKELAIVEVPVATTSDVAAAVRAIAGKVDAFLMVPDNTTLAATTIFVQTALETHKPVIGGDMDTVRKGSLATYGYNYFELGKTTAQMVKEILIDRKDPRNMPVKYPPHTSLIINESVCTKIGLKIPSELRKQAEEIVK